MSNSLLLPLLTLLIGCGGVKLNPKHPYRVLQVETQVSLSEELSTGAAITFPDQGKTPRPTVILVPSSGPMDRDHTLIGPTGPTLLFSDLADALSSRGFAVVRYNKRHVAGFREYDLRRFVTDDTPAVQAADLRRIVEAVRGHQRVQADKIYLYGFGEGAQVATAVALDTPVAGLLVQGAAGMPYPERMTGWFKDLLVPYLEGYGIRGVVNGFLLGKAIQAPVTPPVLQCAEMLAVSYTRDADIVKISPLVDANRDGLLELEAELLPAVPNLVELAFGPIGNLRQHQGKHALPTLDVALHDLNIPLLVLQGMQDATATPLNAERIENTLIEINHPDYTIARFNGVGHTLGMARSPLDDLPRPMAVRPLNRIIDWLVVHAESKAR